MLEDLKKLYNYYLTEKNAIQRNNMIALLFLIIYIMIIFERYNCAIQRNNMLLLVVTDNNGKECLPVSRLLKTTLKMLNF